MTTEGKSVAIRILPDALGRKGMQGFVRIGRTSGLVTIRQPAAPVIVERVKP